MRKLNHKKENTKDVWIPKSDYDELIHDDITSPAYYSKDDITLNSGCIFCEEKKCLEFNERELGFSTLREERKICPTSALRINFGKNVVEIRKEYCIGCGLCIFRCIYGAIYFNNKEKAEINERVDGAYEVVEEESKEKYYDNFKIIRKINQGKDIIKENLANISKSLDQNIYYPLVSNILTMVGLNTSLPREGDTNDRIDAKIKEDFGIIPIEIKSPSETTNISLKAIRQALENKVIIQSRYKNNEKRDIDRDLTSIVVGFEKPRERSDILRVIEDIKNSYDINIGLLYIDDLLNFLLKGSINKKKLLYHRGIWDEETE